MKTDIFGEPYDTEKDRERLSCELIKYRAKYFHLEQKVKDLAVAKWFAANPEYANEEISCLFDGINESLRYLEIGEKWFLAENE